MLSNCFHRILWILWKQFAVAVEFPKEHDLPMGKVKGIGITTLGSQRTRMDKINTKFWKRGVFSMQSWSQRDWDFLKVSNDIDIFLNLKMQNIMQDHYQINSAPLWLACHLFLKLSSISMLNNQLLFDKYIYLSIIKKKTSNYS